MKKIIALLIAVLVVFCAVACNNTKPNDDVTTDADTKTAGDETTAADVKGEGVLTYADYVAAENGTTVSIEAYIQAIAYSASYGNAGLYLQDKDGGYYVYRMTCNDEDYAKLNVKGQKVKITGTKTEWSGLIEFDQGTTTYELEEGNYIAEAADVSTLDAKALEAYMNQFVTFKDAEVVASKYTDGDGNEQEAAFLYNYNGSGEKGSDIYYNIKAGENVFTFVVETDLCNADSDVYKAAEGLNVGDKVTLEGFMYWYNAPQLHTTLIVK